MEQMIGGYPVDDFPIYADFWTGDEVVSRFVSFVDVERGANNERFKYEGYRLVWRKYGPGDWVLVLEDTDRVWGEIKLRPDGDKIQFTATSITYGDIRWKAVKWYIREHLRPYLADEGLLYPPKPAQSARVDTTGAGEKPQGKPSKPNKPDRDAPLSQWFAYRDELKAIDYQYTLKDIANEKGLSHDYVRQEHAKYRAEHGFTNT